MAQSGNRPNDYERRMLSSALAFFFICHPCNQSMTASSEPWEHIAEKLSGAGWSVEVTGYRRGSRRPVYTISASEGGPRLTIHSDNLLTGLLELESAVADISALNQGTE